MHLTSTFCGSGLQYSRVNIYNALFYAISCHKSLSHRPGFYMETEKYSDGLSSHKFFSKFHFHIIIGDQNFRHVHKHNVLVKVVSDSACMLILHNRLPWCHLQ